MGRVAAHPKKKTAAEHEARRPIESLWEDYGVPVATAPAVAFCTEVETTPNVLDRLVPSVVSAAIITTAMRAAMRPYSIAVAPFSSLRNWVIVHSKWVFRRDGISVADVARTGRMTTCDAFAKYFFSEDFFPNWEASFKADSRRSIQLDLEVGQRPPSRCATRNEGAWPAPAGCEDVLRFESQGATGKTEGVSRC